MELFDLSNVPLPLEVRPDLTEDDVRWLNAHLELAGNPEFRYVRRVPRNSSWKVVSY